MKNNIIIAGVPRAGKSTVSHILSQEYGYQHVSMDSIIAGFEKCFPESVIANSNEVGIDLFDEYRKKVGSEGDFLGTQYLNFNELSEEGGYSDADNYKASISIITDIPEDQITSLHIEHIKVYFNVSGTNRYTEIYALTYETGGLWYMYELQDIDNGFDAE